MKLKLQVSEFSGKLNIKTMIDYRYFLAISRLKHLSIVKQYGHSLKLTFLINLRLKLRKLLISLKCFSLYI